MVRLFFYRSSGLPALLTRLWTWDRKGGQKFTDVPAHVAFCFVSEDSEGIYEAVSTGVRLRDEWSSPHHSISLNVPDQAAAQTFARAQLGKRYDWLAIIADVLFRFVPKLAVRDLDNDKWTCSRLAAQMLIEGERTTIDCRLPLSPNDLYVWLTEGRHVS